jgi:hypothetical protein
VIEGRHGGGARFVLRGLAREDFQFRNASQVNSTQIQL